MAMSAAATLPLLPPSSVRSFALLDQAERDRLAGILRPLAWIDGLVTAIILAPEENDDWLDHVWIEEGLGELTFPQAEDIATIVEDHFVHVADMLYDDTRAYRPYLNGAGDRMEAAAEWAAGFRFGILLLPEPWAPLICDDDARALLCAIFSLERDEDQLEAARAESPFRDMSPERREHMRHTALNMLPEIVLSLHNHSLSLDQHDADDGTKVGRNDPCPCGSGKKYKKCCLE